MAELVILITDDQIIKCNFYFFLKKRENWCAVSLFSGAAGTMAESEFQRSLHCLDSHKSSASVCGVCIKVRRLIIHPPIHPSAHPRPDRAVLWCAGTGCRWTSRPCCCSPTRGTWRSWGRCCTTCTNTWTAAPPSSTWVCRSWWSLVGMMNI